MISNVDGNEKQRKIFEVTWNNMGAVYVPYHVPVTIVITIPVHLLVYFKADWQKTLDEIPTPCVVALLSSFFFRKNFVFNLPVRWSTSITFVKFVASEQEHKGQLNI
jgi:hypothetical protein